jgi:hypothetical protein
MNDPENQIPATHDVTQTPDQFESLRQLVNWILVLLVIVSGTLTVFLLHQYRFVHQEVLVIRPQYAEAKARYHQVQPKMDDFIRRMSEFARTHPDFAAVLSKYRPTTGIAAAQGKK